MKALWLSNHAGEGAAEIDRHYEKPSERRIREKSEAIRRARKLAHKELQYYFCCAFARMI